MSEGIEWPFYGRDRQLDRIDRLLSHPVFGAYVVHGRRGVGKTRLLEEAAKRHAAAGGRTTVICELPAEPGAGDLSIKRLEAATARVGVRHMLDDMPKRESYHYDWMWFADGAAHLIRKRVNVVLDEFHHAAGGLDGDIKLMIDRFRNETEGAGRRVVPDRGTLMVMGSHQQKLHGMLERTKPLHGRFGAGVDLKPWSVATVFEMARDQGLLAHPDRFLTLWNAFGGMPDQWRRFVMEPEFAALRDLDDWLDGRAWRQAFIRAQREWLREHREDRFDNIAYVELADEHREALWALAGKGRYGVSRRELRREWRRRSESDPERSLKVLRDDLGMVEDRDEYLGNGGYLRWRLVDPVARFQLDVSRIDPRKAIRHGAAAPECPETDDGEESPAGDDGALKRLEQQEGLALERLVAETFRAMPGVYRSLSGVSRFRGADGRPVDGEPEVEMDLLVQPYIKAGSPMVFGSCKRSARQLSGVNLDGEIDRLMARIPTEGETGPLHGLQRRKLLVASEIPEGMRPGLENRGSGLGGNYVCVDVSDLAGVALDLRARVRAAVTAKARAKEKLMARTRVCAKRVTEVAAAAGGAKAGAEARANRARVRIREAAEEAVSASTRLERAEAAASAREHWLTEMFLTGERSPVDAMELPSQGGDDGFGP